MLALVSCPGTAHAKMLFAVRWWPVYSSSSHAGPNVSVGYLLGVGSLQDCVVMVSSAEHPAMCLSVMVVERDVVGLFGLANVQKVRPHPLVCFRFSWGFAEGR